MPSLNKFKSRLTFNCGCGGGGGEQILKCDNKLSLTLIGSLMRGSGAGGKEAGSLPIGLVEFHPSGLGSICLSVEHVERRHSHKFQNSVISSLFKHICM